MAKKSAAAKERLKKIVTDAYEKLVEFGKQFPKDSVERERWNLYLKATREYDEAWSTGDLGQIDKAQRLMFQTYDAWQRVTNEKFSVSYADAQAIVLDALMTNAEAMPDEFAQLSGLVRHRRGIELAQDIIDAWIEEKVRVAEVPDLDAPYCADCLEELSA